MLGSLSQNIKRTANNTAGSGIRLGTCLRPSGTSAKASKRPKCLAAQTRKARTFARMRFCGTRRGASGAGRRASTSTVGSLLVMALTGDSMALSLCWSLVVRITSKHRRGTALKPNPRRSDRQRVTIAGLPRGLLQTECSPLDYRDVDLLRMLLWEHLEAAKLTVVAHGDSLILVSGTRPNHRKYARLTRLGQDRWSISLPSPRGTWEKTPHVGRIEDMVRKLADDTASCPERT